MLMFYLALYESQIIEQTELKFVTLVLVFAVFAILWAENKPGIKLCGAYFADQSFGEFLPL